MPEDDVTRVAVDFLPMSQSSLFHKLYANLVI